MNNPDRPSAMGRRRRSPSQPPTGPARFLSDGSNTSADRVYDKLRIAITTMELTPGTPISEQHLAQQYGMSRTPIREAIHRLANEKLVEIAPKSGTFVGRIPVSSLVEAMVARRALETVNVRKATENVTKEQIADFREMIETQHGLVEQGDLAAFHRADEIFHAYFATVAGYDGIWELVRKVKQQVDRYRQLTLPQEGRLIAVVTEHNAIVEAMAAGNADAATAAMQTHLDKLQLDIDVFGDLWPDYFIHDHTLD